MDMLYIQTYAHDVMQDEWLCKVVLKNTVLRLHERLSLLVFDG
jgi:hypothetical protein